MTLQESIEFPKILNTLGHSKRATYLKKVLLCLFQGGLQNKSENGLTNRSDISSVGLYQ